MTRSLALTVLLATTWLTGAVRAQEPTAVTRESTVTATVDSINRYSRVVNFRTADGIIQSVYVEPGLERFDALQVGDVVTARFVESVIVEVRPDAKPTEVRDTTAEAKKAGDEKVLQQFKMVVTIDAIDEQAMLVTYRTNDNRRVLRGVSDRRLLEHLRPGDRVEVTMTRARAISIERPR